VKNVNHLPPKGKNGQEWLEMLCGVKTADYFETEFREKARTINWLSDDELKNIAGPVAFEYSRLKRFMDMGVVEASCWKLANLVEVIIADLFTSALEEDRILYNRYFNNNSTTFAASAKLTQALKIFTRNDIHPKLKELECSLRKAMNWRNSYGVGHGALLSNKGSYIEPLVSHTSAVTRALKGCLKFFEQRLMKDNHNKIMSGELYYKSLHRTDWENRVARNGINGYRDQEPVRIFGCDFDVPDIYYFDNNKKRGAIITRTYRNYRNNYLKYICADGSFNWQEDYAMVAYLNEKEREEWFSNNNMNIEVKLTVLVEAAERLQLMGLYEDMEWCLDKIDSIKSRNNYRLSNHYQLRVALLNYSASAAQGDWVDAEKHIREFRNELSSIADTIQILAKADVEESWFEAKREQIQRADTIIDKGLEKIEPFLEKFPHTLRIKKLELYKNRLYAYRKNKDHEKAKELKDQCLEKLLETVPIYKNDPENYNVISLIGFFCNLYSDYAKTCINHAGITENEKRQEVDKVKQLCEYGLKAREELYYKRPSDIWAIRGYAWSMHVKARILFHYDYNIKEAEDLLERAKDLRQNEIERGDMHIEEDLVKNHIALFEVMGYPNEIYEKTIRAICRHLRKIHEKEGYSERFAGLEKLIIRVCVDACPKRKG